MFRSLVEMREDQTVPFLTENLRSVCIILFFETDDQQLEPTGARKSVTSARNSAWKTETEASLNRIIFPLITVHAGEK